MKRGIRNSSKPKGGKRPPIIDPDDGLKDPDGGARDPIGDV